MSRHFESAPGLCEQPDERTREFVLNQTMLRVRDPAESIDFYTRVLGMRLIRRLDFEEMRFTLFFLGFVDDSRASDIPREDDARTTWTFRQSAMLELTHNWGTENEPGFRYHDGNSEPQGFGHIGVTVPDVYAACERFDTLGVEFVKRPDDGRMRGLAFIRDPDGYWIEILQADMLQRQGRG